MRTRKTTMVRVSPATLTRLKSERDLVYKAYVEGRVALTDDPNPASDISDGLSLDYIINRLLDFKHDHRERSKDAGKTTT